MPKIIYYILFLLVTLAASSQCSGAITVAHTPVNAKAVCKKEVCKLVKHQIGAERYRNHGSFKKGKYIRTRYMKGEIRYVLTPLLEAPCKRYLPIARLHFFYLDHFSSDHHKLAKQRGPPSFLS